MTSGKVNYWQVAASVIAGAVVAGAVSAFMVSTRLQSKPEAEATSEEHTQRHPHQHRDRDPHEDESPDAHEESSGRVAGPPVATPAKVPHADTATRRPGEVPQLVRQRAEDLESGGVPLGPDLDQFDKKQHDVQWRELGNYLTAHDQESRDEQWAKPMEGTIKAELLAETGSKRSYDLIDTDCRSVSCVAHVRWQTLDEARLALGNLMTDTRNVPCVSRAVLPSVTSGVVDVPVYFDCMKSTTVAMDYSKR